jgi:dolichol-phosphate mannosyltransferase
MIIFILGVMGLYIGKIFEEAKGRPFFIISEVINRSEPNVS